MSTSTVVYAWGAVLLALTIWATIALRIGVIGFSSSPAAGAAAGAGAGGGGAAAAGAAGVATASPAPSMTAISALLGTVSPSCTRIAVSVPSKGEGTSALTLSGMTSTLGSDLPH